LQATDLSSAVGQSLSQLLKRPEINHRNLVPILQNLAPELFAKRPTTQDYRRILSSALRNELKSVETRIKYRLNLQQQQRAIGAPEEIRAAQHPRVVRLPLVSGLSRDAGAFTQNPPRTLVMLTRIPVLPGSRVPGVMCSSNPGKAARTGNRSGLTMTTFYTHLVSPVGPLLLAFPILRTSSDYFFAQRRCGIAGIRLARKIQQFSPITIRQLRAYFAGDLETFDLHSPPKGRHFQAEGFGPSLIRSGMARLFPTANSPPHRQPQRSPRRSLANGSNPIPIRDPLPSRHRLNGKLTGYGRWPAHQRKASRP